MDSGHCLLSDASSPEPQEFLSDSDSLKQQTSPEINLNKLLSTATLTYTINHP